jgi:hypothetical protein
MTMAETIRAAGNKVRRSVAPAAEAIATAIRKANEALATARQKHHDAAIVSVSLSTTPEGKTARERADAALDVISGIEKELQHLDVAYRDALKREAVEKASDWEKARATEMALFGQRFAALSKRCESFTARQVEQVDEFQGMLKEADAILTAFPMIDAYHFHPKQLAKACVAEIYRTAAVAADWRARKFEVGFPGTNGDDDQFTDLSNLDQPEKIESLQDALTEMRAMAKQDVLAARDDHSIRRPPDVGPERVPPTSPNRSRPSRLEMYDPEQSTVQRTDLGVDGRPVGPVDHAANAADAEARLAGVARDPAALAAMLRGEIPGAIDLGHQGPNPRQVNSAPPVLHDTVDEHGEWIGRDGQPMPAPDPLNPRNLPEPGIEPAWAPGIEVGGGN